VGLSRSTLLALSRSRTARQAITRVAISRRMARRFVAGESLDDAVAAVLELSARGLLTTLDHLGENVDTQAGALAAADEYLLALEALRAVRTSPAGEAEPGCNVSVKLTQMGLDQGDGFCHANVRRIVRCAEEAGNFVRIDMEGSAYTERTLAVYRRLRAEFDNVGIAIQAYLHRSQSDVQALIEEGIGHFRFCKGVYDEPTAIAYLERPRVTRAMQSLIQMCLAPEALASGAYCAVASHDAEIINYARACAYQHDVAPDRYEFQMLYGIRRDLQAALVSLGYRVRVYVPYGTYWYPFFMRRLAERPANLLFFFRALAGD
jgi:proline dehydrogenase